MKRSDSVPSQNLEPRPGESLAEQVQARLKLTRPPPPALARRLAASAWDAATVSLLEAPLRAVGWAVVDLETTGTNPATAEIIEVGVCIVEGGRVTERYASLVRPAGTVPAYVAALTGIDDAMLEGAPPLAEVLDAARERLRGRVFVAHNASFDLGFLNRALGARGEAPLPNPVLCTKRLARRVRPDLHRRGLDALCGAYDIPIRPRHRALGDAEATARLLVELLELAQAQGAGTLTELLELCRHRPGPAPDFERYAFGPAFLAHLPRGPGVYRMLDDRGNVLYVGKARDLHARVGSYFSGRARGKVAALREALHDLRITPTPSEVEALMLEAAELHALRPPFNVQVQVHRRRFFLRMSVRGRPRRIVATQEPRPDEKCFGPYHLASGPRETARRLREALALAARHGASPDPERLLGGEGAAQTYAALEHELHGRLAARDDRGAETVRTLLLTLRQVLAVSGSGDAFHRRDLLVRLPGVGAPRLFVLRDGFPARLLAREGDAADPESLASEIETILAEPAPAPLEAPTTDLSLLDAWLARHVAEATIDLGDIADGAELRARLETLLRGAPPEDGVLCA